MDRYMSTITGTMNSVLSVGFEIVVVGVAILLGAVAMLHARAHAWRWAPAWAKADSKRF
ncbi:MAG: hypothetical protein LLF97_13215 [Planctomycetaceae bacterium]|nr:hypothetical protein [Planctomycetaceae bacterium]